MWWHHVQALADCNLLVNYWWLGHSQHFGSPFNALLHGILSFAITEASAGPGRG